MYVGGTGAELVTKQNTWCLSGTTKTLETQVRKVRRSRHMEDRGDVKERRSREVG